MKTLTRFRWIRGLAGTGLITLIVATALAAGPTAGHPIGAGVVEGAKANTNAAEIQQRISALDDERSSMFDEYRHLLRQAESIERFNEHLEQLIAGQDAELGELAEREAAIAETHRELLPLMQQMLSTLESFVAMDSPFLRAERQARLERLSELMHAPGMGLAEKYRRLLEAYQVEAEYGRTFATYRAPLNGGKPGGDRIVDILRIGRVGLYYLSPDRESGGAWDAVTRNWYPLDRGQRRRLQIALRVANKTMAPTLLELPLRMPEQRP